MPHHRLYKQAQIHLPKCPGNHSTSLLRPKIQLFRGEKCGRPSHNFKNQKDLSTTTKRTKTRMTPPPANIKLPIVADESIMAPKAHGTSHTPVQANLRWGCKHDLADRYVKFCFPTLHNWCLLILARRNFLEHKWSRCFMVHLFFACHVLHF